MKISGEVVVASLALLFSVYSLWISTQLQTRFNTRENDLERKRLFLTLWDKLVQVNRLNPANPVAVDVLNAINTLELVALLWEADIVDRHMVSIAFADTFVERHNELMQIQSQVKGDGRTGPQLISAHPAITRVLPEIKTMIAGRAVVPRT